ncbi:hypothetical protein, partial [Nonomuraea sp. NPDC003709]|uniref:hypothetical protein n=1 Tax=Nonomuraea sp. NPDC003709 TaxID=3154450 RepID=UPI0033A02A5E
DDGLRRPPPPGRPRAIRRAHPHLDGLTGHQVGRRPGEDADPRGPAAGLPTTLTPGFAALIVEEFQVSLRRASGTYPARFHQVPHSERRPPSGSPAPCLEALATVLADEGQVE